MKSFIFQLVLSFLFINSSCVETNSQSSKNLKKADMNWSIITSGNQCGIEEPKQIIVQTQEAFDELWQSCFQNMPAPITKPTIDFSKEWVIGYFQGFIKSGGHSLNIDSVSATEKGISLAMTHNKPGNNSPFLSPNIS